MRKSECGQSDWPGERILDERDVAEILRHRTGLLADDEKALMRMYLDGGQSVRQIARLAGTSPTTISRRVRGIAKRLVDRTYLACVGGKSEFNTLDLAVIRDHFVRGLSLGRISRRYGLTYYRVRATAQKARRYASRRVDELESKWVGG